MLRPGDVAPSFVARPVFGLEVPVPPPADGRPVVLCFVRNLASPFTRAAMAAIQARYGDFDREGFQVVVITRTDITQTRDFVPRYHVLAPVVVDQDGSLHERYQVGADRSLSGTARALLDPQALGRVFDALQHGHGRPHKDIAQLAAEFVVGPDGRIAFAHYATAVTDQPDLDALLECARAL